MPATHRLPEESGMTLRDYFAAAALQGLLANNDEPELPEDVHMHDYVAANAYEYADSMLKEREKQ